ncbi:allantoinase AllB [Shouchella shacheensis]|uniref:allantoinase AllB n=1 Tax=Shouchella shacheensis TaxID=1649580 RepID=UPI00073FFA4C|nr:allantoinase AllB [Shouchella shacheensis]
MLDTLITGGTVVLGDDVRAADIGVKDGKIHMIAESIPSALAKNVLQADGAYVLPGMVDSHVHLSEPGRAEWEGFETGTKALAAGGTTTYVEMPLNALPATTNRDHLQLKLEAAKGKNYVDYAFYGGLTPSNLHEIEELADAGVLAFKCFLSTCGSDEPGDFQNVDDYTLFKGMELLASKGQLLCIHAENAEMTDGLTEEKIKAGALSAYNYVDSRPIVAEVEAVSRALHFARETGCRLHLVHISSAQAVDLIQAAKADGVDVTLESCPHYFALNADDLAEIGTLAKCQPPLRYANEQEALWDRLLHGEIDWLTSDHSPCTPDLKEGDLFSAWGGISGCQNNVDLMFDLAVKQRGLSLSSFAKLIATAPARRFGLTHKGEIALGKDADFVFVDPNQSYKLSTEDLYYKNPHSPYVGRTIDCRVTRTVLRGETVYTWAEGITSNARGEFQH